MREEAKANAEADNKAKEKVDKINTADSMIFQLKNNLKNLEINFLPTKNPQLKALLLNLKKHIRLRTLTQSIKPLPN